MRNEKEDVSSRGASFFVGEKMEIRKGRLEDIESWDGIVRVARRYFPGLETEEGLRRHREVMLAYIASGEALGAFDGERAAGILLFSKKGRSLDFLIVEEKYRRRGVAEALLREAWKVWSPGAEITVMTHVEDVPEGEAARAFYQREGFRPCEVTEVFGASVERFCKRKK